jgi:hypothetical protein
MPAKSKEIELQPDAWERFERAVTVVMKAPPQHRVKKAKAKRAKSHKKKK